MCGGFGESDAEGHGQHLQLYTKPTNPVHPTNPTNNVGVVDLASQTLKGMGNTFDNTLTNRRVRPQVLLRLALVLFLIRLPSFALLQLPR
jgi:hypothetical protein